MARAPRRGEHVTLHELPPTEEGSRFVLEGRDATFFELPLGERDAFVWARLDGVASLEELGAAYLEAYDSVHPDLPGLVDRLHTAGLLADPAPPPPGVDSGSRIVAWASALAQVRLPAPRARPVWRAIGRLTAPLFTTATGIVTSVVAVVGLLVALAGLAPPVATPLLETPGGSLLGGVLLLLALNLAVDLIEAVAQVGVLARSERPPGRIGLSLDLGVPGIDIETPDAILLPRARRVLLLLAPLLSAAFVGGVAALLLWQVSAAEPTRVLLHKLCWIAWIRALIHCNPLGPGPLYDALRHGLELPGLRKLARRFLRLGPWTDGEAGYSRRELFLLGYCCGVVAFFVLAARLGAALLTLHVLPAWHLAQSTDDVGRLLGLALLAILLGLPTLLALAGGLLLLLQASLQALGRSEWFSDPRSLAGVLAAAALLVAGAPWVLERVGVFGLERVLLDLGWGSTGVLALVGVGLGWALARRSGIGWGGLDGLARGRASATLGGVWGATALGLGAGLGGVLIGVLTLFSAGCLYLWGLVEVSRLLPERPLEVALPPGPRDLLTLRTLLAALGPLTALVLVAWELVAWPQLGPFPALVLPAIGVVTVGALYLAAATWHGRTGARAAGLLLGLAGLITLLVALHAWWSQPRPGALPGPVTAGGLHLPLLSLAFLAGAALLLRQALDAVLTGPRRLPPLQEALQGTDEGTREVSAAAWVLDALALGVIDLYGEGLNRAVAGPLEAEGLSLKGDAPRDRAHRHREAIVRYAYAVGQRTGERVLAELLESALARLPAVAHERLEAHAHALLPGLGSIAAAPAARRRALLGGVVQLTDFDEPALNKLADWLGVLLAEAGRVVIRQGEHGERFFLVVSGRLEVWVEGPGGDEQRVAVLGPGDAFGEAALLTHATRTATVVATETSLLLTLERPVFAELLRARPDLLAHVVARQEDLALVREVPLFAELSGAQVAALCRRFRLDQAGAGDAIVTQGEPGERFFLIRDGEVAVQRRDDDQDPAAEPRRLATLRRGDYFGEIALLHDQPRTASVVALADTQLLTLDRAAFQSLLSGAPREALEASSSQRLASLGGDA